MYVYVQILVRYKDTIVSVIEKTYTKNEHISKEKLESE